MIENLNKNLFDSQFGIMGGSLGLRLARHDFSSNNLANMETPGFRAKHLDFEKVLATNLPGSLNELSVRQTNAKHIPSQDPVKAFSRAARAINRSPYGWDENDDDILDIDKEMTLLTKNQLIYNTTVQMLAKEFDNLKYAIGEGGGGQ
ncbi:MAG: flagellar basal body rod protein FlgB [Deltaproteobacteria bacterium]|jgi:flagellar basal-body rod protein FlgB|nr:flagellar basal body rod protein FlgB [Deltaproteobacteria bacterium]